MRKNKFRLIVALCGANWIHSNRSFANIFYRNSANVEKIICHSKYERDYKLCTVDRLKDKMTIIPNGVDLEDFDDNNMTRNDLASDISSKRWILNVSNFFPGKGQNHLIDILRLLPDPDEFVYIQVSHDIDFAVGQQNELEWKKHATVKLGDRGISFRLMKNISREHVIGFFKHSNVFAFVSEKEVAPIVLLESMASGLPWVATNIGNAAGLEGGKCIGAVKDSRYHSYFDDRVKRLFAESIMEMLNTPVIGESGRRHIERELTWKRILPKYSEVIEL